MEVKGLFNLENFNEKKNDDIMEMNINEAGDVSIPVPGGDKEQPTAKPVEGTNVPIPGGDSETPTAKPYDAASITIPSGTEITRDEWNNMMTTFQKSFKEAAEMIEAVKNGNINIVEKTEDELQAQYTEAAIGDAILKSYEDGPLYEKVDKSDKADVKEIVRKLRSKVDKYCKSEGVHFYQPNLVARILVGGATTVTIGVGAGHFAAGIQQIISTRLWQVLGICHIEDGNVKTVTDKLTEKFADELGDYKVLYLKAVPTIFDSFKTHFGWKDNRGCYFLLVDKKMPSEIKSAVEALNKEVQKVKADAGKEEKK